MTAYLIVRAEITNPEQYREYLKIAPGIIESYGGKAIVRAGKTETLEGTEENRRIVIFGSQS